MKLTPQHREKLAWIIIAIVSLIISITLGVNYPLAPEQQAPQADAPPAPDAIVELGVTHFTSLNVAETMSYAPLGSTLVSTQTLTPAATFYEFAPATVLTLTLATGSATVGDLLILQNTVSTNTVILDTGATGGGSNITLGLNDLALFIFTNTKWVEIVSIDNS